MKHFEHQRHGNYPSEKNLGRKLSARTMAVLDRDEVQREAEYHRYLTLRETPKYQEQLRAALERRGLAVGGRLP